MTCQYIIHLLTKRPEIMEVVTAVYPRACTGPSYYGSAQFSREFFRARPRSAMAISLKHARSWRHRAEQPPARIIGTVTDGSDDFCDAQ